MSQPQSILTVTVALIAAVSFHAHAQMQFSGGMLGAMKARHIGPAVMSGRISDLVVSDSNPRRVYAGAAGGGVWKSTNGGVSFSSIFDDQPQSIGALAIDHARPDTLWVGTGESWTRNSVSYGLGVFLTTDGGRNWRNVGLTNTERIARVAIHPTDSKTVFVAALGALFSDSDNRGLYKTTDFGATWERVLAVDSKTGCADVVIDPNNPSILFAAMWQVRRTAWSFSSGGSGSGLYKSVDGGATWNKITNGLPTGDLGRICVAISPADTKVIYANVESDKTSMYRSSDGGTTWEKRFDGSASSLRPFYFSRIVCDPKNKDVVYKAGLNLFRSKDGASTFESVANSAHSDHHSIWVDPLRPEHFLTGTDGGIYESYDEGKNVRFLSTLPVSQFYHVAIDDQKPYRVYGGLQDNGSWSAPSDGPIGIRQGDWTFIGGGDGFCVVPEKSDPKIVYWESQGGEAYRTDLYTQESKSIKPTTDNDSLKLRFNWNTPIVHSPTKPNVIYMGSQFVHRSTNRGDSWVRFSSDITTNDKNKLQQELSGGVTVDNSSAENHCTVVSIAESPLDAQIVWAGTDDGNIQVSTNDGKSWNNTTINISDSKFKGHWVSSVEPSSVERGVCYVTLDGHMKGDMRPYVLATKDFGKTWTLLDTVGIEGYAHVVRQDPLAQQILYLGTELGLYVSLNGGQNWAAFRNKVPKVAIRDMVVNKKANDLVIATHGRGILILDDLDILRSIKPESISNDLTVLPTKPGIRRLGGMGAWFAGDESFVGPGEDESARVWYVLKERHIKGKFTAYLKDATGKVVRTIPASTRKGLNSIDVPLRMLAPLTARSEVAMAGGSFTGPLLPEGKYTIEFDKNGTITTTTIDVITDTIYKHSSADRLAQQKLVSTLFNLNEELAITVERVQSMQKKVNDLLKDTVALASSNNSTVKSELKSYADTLTGLNKSFVNTKANLLSGEEQLRERIASLYGEVNGYLGRPTDSQEKLAEVLGGRIRKATSDAENLIAMSTAIDSKLSFANVGKINTETRAETEARLRKK